jgi:hypothetical protein
MVSSEQQLCWLGQRGGGTAIFEKGPQQILNLQLQKLTKNCLLFRFHLY